MPSRSTSRRSTIAGRRSTSSSIRGTVARPRSRRVMRADPGGGSAFGQIPASLAEICRVLANVVAGARGKALIDDLRATVGGTPTEILSQALSADCLRVVYSAVMTDGLIEDREIEALYEIIAAAARHYA